MVVVFLRHSPVLPHAGGELGGSSLGRFEMELDWVISAPELVVWR